LDETQREKLCMLAAKCLYAPPSLSSHSNSLTRTYAHPQPEIYRHHKEVQDRLEADERELAQERVQAPAAEAVLLRAPSERGSGAAARAEVQSMVGTVIRRNRPLGGTGLERAATVYGTAASSASMAASPGANAYAASTNDNNNSNNNNSGAAVGGSGAALAREMSAGGTSGMLLSSSPSATLGGGAGGGSGPSGEPTEHHLLFEMKALIAQIAMTSTETAELFFSLYNAVRSDREIESVCVCVRE
jgi:hypothetical protein